MTSPVPAARELARVRDLEVVERAFARGRRGRVEATLHRETLARARVMMTSEQLKAFDVSQEPAARRSPSTATRPFGRGCLAARRLIEVGVRCVEVTLGGWDTHVNNHEIHKARAKVLDPAFAALLRDLSRRQSARPHGRPLLRRVRPHAQGQPAGRPRPLAGRLQPGHRRRRPPRRPGDRPDRSRGRQGPRPADHDRGRARDRADRPRPQPGQGEHRPGDRPADQAQRGQADPRAAILIRRMLHRLPGG